MENLKVKHRYLIKTPVWNDIHEIVVIEKTQTSVNIKFNGGIVTWLPNDLAGWGTIIEDLGETESLKDSVNNFIAKIDDTTAFGCSHHNHCNHRVYIDGLNYEQAKKIEYFLNEIVFKNFFR